MKPIQKTYPRTYPPSQSKQGTHFNDHSTHNHSKHQSYKKEHINNKIIKLHKNLSRITIEMDHSTIEQTQGPTPQNEPHSTNQSARTSQTTTTEQTT